MIFVRVFALVFLFLARLRFPSNKSICFVIRERYGNGIVKLVRRFEKVDFKLRKASLDLDFLERCQKNNYVPNFLNFRVSSKRLKDSKAYNSCQTRLLNEEISLKKSAVRQLKTEFKSLKDILQVKLNSIDFAHICSLFLTSNDKTLKRHSETHEKKFASLVSLSSKNRDTRKIIFNYSGHKLSEHETSLLSKGLNFAVPPTRLNYADYLVNFELLFRDIKSLDLSREDYDFVKTKIKDTALTSFRAFKNHGIGNNLSDEELDALRKLSKKLDIVIQKSDKGNSVVIVDKAAYVNRVMSLLSNSDKFQSLDIEEDKKLNFIINQEKRIRSVFKSLWDNGSITEDVYNKLCPTGSRFGTMYGLPKVHKMIVDNCPQYRPILSAIGTPTYNLAKFLVPLLSGLTTNEYTVKDSFAFAKEVVDQDASLHMASLDVDSLFTNIPLEETLNICVNSLFSNTDTVEGLSRRDFKNLLTLAVSESYFVFNGKCFKQVDGVAMGSPLGPTLANAFLCYHEKNWLENCPLSFMPLHYRRYVDDIFVLFRSKEHVSLFKDYLSSRHPNINFSSEEESQNKLPFLDVSVERVNGHFATSVYRKPTFSGLYTNFVSFIPISYKIGLVSTLIFRCFSICSDMSRFHEELVKLKEIFKKNGYPQSLVEKCI